MAYSHDKSRTPSIPSLNVVIVTGRIATEPKPFSTGKGGQFRLAIQDYRKDAEGKTTTYHTYWTIFVKNEGWWNAIGRYLARNKLVIVQGKLNSLPPKTEGRGEFQFIDATEIKMLDAPGTFADADAKRTPGPKDIVHEMHEPAREDAFQDGPDDSLPF